MDSYLNAKIAMFIHPEYFRDCWFYLLERGGSLSSNRDNEWKQIFLLRGSTSDIPTHEAAGHEPRIRMFFIQYQLLAENQQFALTRPWERTYFILRIKIFWYANNVSYFDTQCKFLHDVDCVRKIFLKICPFRKILE